MVFDNICYMIFKFQIKLTAMGFFKLPQEKAKIVVYGLFGVWSMALILQIIQEFTIYKDDNFNKAPFLLINPSTVIIITLAALSILIISFVEGSFKADQVGIRLLISIIFSISIILLGIIVIRYYIASNVLCDSNFIFFRSSTNRFSIIFICVCMYQLIQQKTIISFTCLFLAIGILCFIIYQIYNFYNYMKEIDIVQKKIQKIGNMVYGSD